MARKFFTPIDLTGLELLNATVQNLASNPSPYGKGHVYFNTVSNELRVYDGSAWIPVGGSVEYGTLASRPAAGNAGRLYVDTDTGTLYLDNSSSWVQVGASATGSVSSITGTTNQIVRDSSTGDVTLSLANQVHVVDSLSVGNSGYDGSLTVNNYSGSGTVFEVTTAGESYFRKTNGDVIVKVDTASNLIILDNWGYLQFKDNSATVQGELYTDDGFYLTSLNNYELGVYSAGHLGLTANNNQDIDIEAYGTGLVNVHSPQFTKELTVGGSTDTHAGQFTVKAADDTIIFGVDADAGELSARGTVYFKKPDNTQILSIHGDGGSEAVIDAPNGDLILVSDGDSYLQSNGSASNQIATKGYVDGAVAGLTWKQAANLLSNVNVVLSGTSGDLTIDNHVLNAAANNYRIVLIGQTTTSDNGIYTYSDDGSTYSLTRSADADAYAELKGAAIFIQEGDVYGATSWIQTNHYLTSFSSQTWVQFSGQGTYLAGNGISISGQTIAVHNDDTLQFTGGAVGVNYGDGLETGGSGELKAKVGTGLTTSSGSIAFDSGYGVRKYALTIGDNSSTSFDVTHNFSDLDVVVSIYDSTTKEEVFADVVHYTNKVTVSFASAPATNAFRVVVVG